MMMDTRAKLSWCGGGVVVFLAMTVLADEDYLPYFGPPPLRFAVQTSSMLATPQQSAMTVSPTKGQAQTAGELTGGTNVLLKTTASLSTNVPANAVTGQAVEYKAGLLPVAPSLPGGDWLTVQPEMLMDYFKPLPGRHNQGGVYFPVNVGFTPPVSQPAQQSRATYKKQ